MAGQHHVRKVQAHFRGRGGDYRAFSAVVDMAWHQLDGKAFNSVLGVFRLDEPAGDTVTPFLLGVT